jgi:3-hydroxyisobutyrate dehydrogenase-like beta-hydroxyacid dehydrogenase
VTPNIRIAVIGPGDAGSLLARDLTTAGAEVIGFDLSPLPESSTPVAETMDEAVAGADIVLSFNSSSAALRAADRVSGILGTGAIFADLNTATPALKRKLAEKFAPDAFVDVAIMSPLSATDEQSVLAVAGPAAQTFIDRLAPLGLTLELVSAVVGQAAARNLTRSMLSKVLAGAVIDYMWAAEAMGLEDWAHDEMLRAFDAMTRNTATGYLEETVKNAKRREIEMLDIVEMLEEAGYHSLFVPPTQLVYNKVYHSIKVPHANQ